MSSPRTTVIEATPTHAHNHAARLTFTEDPPENGADSCDDAHGRFAMCDVLFRFLFLAHTRGKARQGRGCYPLQIAVYVSGIVFWFARSARRSTYSLQYRGTQRANAANRVTSPPRRCKYVYVNRQSDLATTAAAPPTTKCSAAETPMTMLYQQYTRIYTSTTYTYTIVRVVYSL